MFNHLRHLPVQVPVLRALGRVALLSLRDQSVGRVRGNRDSPLTPGPVFTAELPPRPRSLIDDYLDHVGGRAADYRGTVPPHLFAQWAFVLQMRAFEGIGYPAAQVLNGGCRLTLNSPIPDNEPLHVSAQLSDIDDNGRRVVVSQRIVTQTKSAPAALVADWQGIIRLKGGTSTKPREPKNLVPSDAQPLAYWRLSTSIGLQFALLTGDFNPVHWSPLYARMMGFGNQITHGFSSMARTMESLIRAKANGDPTGLESFECRFTRPLVLPAPVVVYSTADNRVFVGDAPSSPAYLTGAYCLRGQRG